MEFDQVKKLLTDDSYQATLSGIAEQIGHRIDHDMDIPVLSVGWTKIRHSGLKEADFYRLLREHDRELVAYYVKGYEMFPGDLVQEHPELKKPEEDEIIEKMDMSILALVLVMIEFHYLLDNDEQGLIRFFKKEGMLDFEEYLRQCRTAFKKIISTLNN